jgi:hypothetical protein
VAEVVKSTTYFVLAPAAPDGELWVTVTFETELALAGAAMIRSAAIEAASVAVPIASVRSP